MTFPSARTRHPHLAICLTLFLSLGTGLARAADEQPAAGNTFSTPSYPAATPRAGGAGAPTTATPAAGTQPTHPTAQRALQNGAAQRPGAAATGTTPPISDPGVRRADLPPPKPSEFQKFVEAATGRMLPLFGAGFFTGFPAGLRATFFAAFFRATGFFFDLRAAMSVPSLRKMC